MLTLKPINDDKKQIVLTDELNSESQRTTTQIHRAEGGLTRDGVGAYPWGAGLA